MDGISSLRCVLCIPPTAAQRRFASSRLSPHGLAAAAALLLPASSFLQRYRNMGRLVQAAQTLPKPACKSMGFMAGPDCGEPEMVEGT